MKIRRYHIFVANMIFLKYRIFRVFKNFPEKRKTRKILKIPKSLLVQPIPTTPRNFSQKYRCIQSELARNENKSGVVCSIDRTVVHNELIYILTIKLSQFPLFYWYLRSFVKITMNFRLHLHTLQLA